MKNQMKNYRGVLLLLLVTVLSCSKTQPKTSANADSDIPVIDLEKALDNVSNDVVDFSEFVIDITYIPLETNEQSMLGGKHEPVYNITPKHIFAGDLMFNRDGKFIRRLGKIGQGPGEYTIAKGIAVNEERNEMYIYSLWTHEILIYNMDNNEFKRKIKVHPSGDRIYSLGNGNLLMDRIWAYFFDDFFEFQLVNVEQGDTIYTRRTGAVKEGYNEKGSAAGVDKNIFWGFGDQMSYYEFFSDTIFALKNGKISVPRYKIHSGKYKYTEEIMHKIENHTYRQANYLKIGQIVESSQFLFFSLTYNETLYYACYDKTTSRVRINVFDQFFNNDIDGGFTWLFKDIMGEKKGFYSFFPYLGKERIEELSQKNTSYDKTKNENLRKLISRVKEDDNTIFYFLDLK